MMFYHSSRKENVALTPSLKGGRNRKIRSSSSSSVTQWVNLQTVWDMLGPCLKKQKPTTAMTPDTTVWGGSQDAPSSVQWFLWPDGHILQNGACCTHRTKAGPFLRMHNAAQGSMEKHPGLVTLRYWINYWCYVWRPHYQIYQASWPRSAAQPHSLRDCTLITSPDHLLPEASFSHLSGSSINQRHTIPCLCFTHYISFYFSYGPMSLILELKMTMKLYLDSVLWGLRSYGNPDPPTKDEPCRLFLPSVSVCLGLNQAEAPFQLESPSGAFTVKWKSKKTKWLL